VSSRVRRRRGLLLISLSLASGGMAASVVHDRVASVERRVGPLVTVAVAARDLAAGDRLRSRDIRLRRVPAAYVPRDALGPDALTPAALAGAGRAGVPVAAGSYLTAGLLGRGAARRSAALRPGQRAVEVAVAGGPALATAAPGSRVDVVVSTEPRDGPGRTFVAIAGAELLALRPAGDAEAPEHAGAAIPSEGARAIATLRVTLRQAVYLTAAQNFAREVRLLARAPMDGRRAGRATVTAGGL
jgi:pilus assembly protein CpaB